MRGPHEGAAWCGAGLATLPFSRQSLCCGAVPPQVWPPPCGTLVPGVAPKATVASGYHVQVKEIDTSGQGEVSFGEFATVMTGPPCSVQKALVSASSAPILMFQASPDPVQCHPCPACAVPSVSRLCRVSCSCHVQCN